MPFEEYSKSENTTVCDVGLLLSQSIIARPGWRIHEWLRRVLPL